jgi:hypothetical protein
MHHKTNTLIIKAVLGGLILSGGAAMAQEAKFKDLVGGDGIKAFDTLTSRGFTSVETTNSPDGFTVSWWYNAKTGQCINTQTKDNKVEFADAGQHPKCAEAASKAGGSQDTNQAASSEPSKQAKKACAAKFGGKSKIKTVTALKPGWWEIIMTGKKGRQVACTVDNSGKIDDWVEM